MISEALSYPAIISTYEPEVGIIASNRRINDVSDLCDQGALIIDTEEALDAARNSLKNKTFQNGLDPLGNAKRYKELAITHGENSEEARAQLAVLRTDMLTLLGEEINDFGITEVTYGINNGKLNAAGQNLSEVYARCLVSADANTPNWMYERFGIELQEILSMEHLIKTCQAEGKTYMVISPTPFNIPASELKTYGMRNSLMIRFMRYNPADETVTFSQIQMPQDNIEPADFVKLFQELESPIKAGNFIDFATNILASGRLIDSEYLNDYTDIAKMLDQIIAEKKIRILRRNAFMGRFVVRAARAEKYRSIYKDTEQRLARQQDTIDSMVSKILELSLNRDYLSPSDFVSFGDEAKKMAFDRMGRKFMRKRYGRKITKAYESGGYEEAKKAGVDPGLSGTCPANLSSQQNSPENNDNNFICREVKSGDRVYCQQSTCKKYVTATVPEKGGTVYCSECGCSTHCADKISIAKKSKINNGEQSSNNKNASKNNSQSSNNKNGSKEGWKDTGLGLFFFVKEEKPAGEREALLAAKQDQFALAA